MGSASPHVSQTFRRLSRSAVESVFHSHFQYPFLGSLFSGLTGLPKPLKTNEKIFSCRFQVDFKHGSRMAAGVGSDFKRDWKFERLGFSSAG